MTCDKARDLLSPHTDGELEPGLAGELEAHLAVCHECSAEVAALRVSVLRMREPELRYSPPSHLEARIRSAIRAESKTRFAVHPAWLAAAACFILAVAMGWMAFVQEPQRAESRLIAHEIVSSHIRSLQANHLFDVPSEDRHTVKPWFDGRLNFSPDVRDLTPQGFRLTGGRLDSIDGHAVAALVFQRRLHDINLYIWPEGSGDAAPRAAASANGYNIVHWTKDGMNYWAIADIPTDELQQFAKLYRE